MKKFIYAMILMAGISFTASNMTIAQDTKAKTACCTKDAKGKCPMAAKADCQKNCPMAAKKDCPKNCPKANCTMTSAKKSKTKSAPVAQLKK